MVLRKQTDKLISLLLDIELTLSKLGAMEGGVFLQALKLIEGFVSSFSQLRGYGRLNSGCYIGCNRLRGPQVIAKSPRRHFPIPRTWGTP